MQRAIEDMNKEDETPHWHLTTKCMAQAFQMIVGALQIFSNNDDPNRNGALKWVGE